MHYKPRLDREEAHLLDQDQWELFREFRSYGDSG
jgi:hypothetical protein